MRAAIIGRMERYEIRVAGHVGSRLAAALGCRLDEPQASVSVLVFDAIDQAALYGLISRLRDLGLELVAVDRTALRGVAGPEVEAPG